MITVQAQIGFRVEREADAYRIMLAIADLVMPEEGGTVTSTMSPSAINLTAGNAGSVIWEHPRLREGCPRCGKNVDLGALAGHLKEHGMRGEW